MGVIERFIEAISYLGYSENKKEFCKKVDVPRDRLYKTESQKAMPGIGTLSQIVKIFPHDVNWLWVLAEKGEMLSSEQNNYEGNYIHANIVNKSKISYKKNEAQNSLEEHMISLYEENKKLREKIEVLLVEKINYLQNK